MKCVAKFLLVACAAASAQPGEYQWVNQELRDRNTPQERTVAIGRGDFAQCSADARLTVQRSVNFPDCSAVMSSPNVFLAQECTERLEGAKKSSEQLFKDSVVGCMARKGWLWTKVR